MFPVNIRSLQHFLYCPHRWGLIELERVWEENVFVAKAAVAHNRVESGEHRFNTKDMRVYSNITVYHDGLELYGVVDCIEFHKSRGGISLSGQDGKYIIRIVEYKPTSCKNASYRIEDALQVYAQKVCVDELFGCDSEGYLYYSNTRRRVKLQFDTETESFERLLNETLSAIRNNYMKGEIPQPKYGKKCNGCSLKERCLPNVQAGIIRQQIFAQESEA